MVNVDFVLISISLHRFFDVQHAMCLPMRLNPTPKANMAVVKYIRFMSFHESSSFLFFCVYPIFLPLITNFL